MRNVAAKPPAAAEPHVVVATAVYFSDQVQKLFRLRKSTLRREIREGRLRVAKRAGRYFFLGQWLIDWIEAAASKASA